MNDDIARCRGDGSDAEGWREGCADCLRRTAPVKPGRLYTSIEPPLIVVFECELRIPPEVTP